MKKNLIIKYIAKKLIQQRPDLKEARRVFGKEGYLELVRGSVISELSPEFRNEIETILRKRFNLKPHTCVFCNEPTVEQWVADITGLFSEEDIYTVFSQNSGLPPEKIRISKYGDNIMDKNAIEEIVKLLEVSTGRKLEHIGYLRGDDDYTYKDIAKFFAV